MPAVTAKSVAGINPCQENGIQAFESLNSIVDELKKLPGFFETITKEDIEAFLCTINLVASYVRNIFKYNVKEDHCHIKSHCVTFSASDAKEKPYQKKCQVTDSMEQGTDIMELKFKLNNTLFHIGNFKLMLIEQSRASFTVFYKKLLNVVAVKNFKFIDQNWLFLLYTFYCYDSRVGCKKELSFVFISRGISIVDDNDGSGHGGSSCPFCEAVPTICKIVRGLLEHFKIHLDGTNYNKWLYKLEHAELDINLYKNFVLRSIPSINVWNNQIQRKLPHEAFLTIGNRITAEICAKFDNKGPALKWMALWSWKNPTSHS